MRLAPLRLASLLALLLASSSLLPGQSFPTSGFADHVVLADFNRDGFPDMAVVTEEPAGLDVFFNDHHGGFGNFTVYSIPSTGPALAVDINGDGWPDILIARGSGSAKTLLLRDAS